MMFMDWRDGHLSPDAKDRNRKLPTFLYVMPFTKNKIFVEETSLVARPFVPFDDLKLRLKQRLQGLGIKVKAVEDEEYCLIPMGGVLPKIPQQTIGIGGTAGMVHPATGYMVSKSLGQAPVLVDAIEKGIKMHMQNKDQANATAVSKMVWDSIWPDEDKRQRTFMCFGMEILMTLNVDVTRRFFKTFFSLPQKMWGGFLSWKISSLGLLGVGLSIFKSASNQLRYDFVKNALPYLPSFVKTFVQGGNDFNSKAWAGLYEIMSELRPAITRQQRPTKTAPSAVSAAVEENNDFNSTGGLAGSNPTFKPITKSELDFPSMILNPNKEATASSGIDSGPPADLEKIEPPGTLTDDREWIRFQQDKKFEDQPKIIDSLPPLQNKAEVDVVVAGVGPAGLALAGALGRKGLKVGLIGPDTPFTNNYGVWVDEFEELGLEHTLVDTYEDALVSCDENGLVPVGRRYGRVGRKELREELLSRCQDSKNVFYYPGLVSSTKEEGAKSEESDEVRRVRLTDGSEFTGKLVTMSTGHNRDVLSYEDGNLPMWQTAYGIEVDMPGHPWDPKKAVFMDLTQSDEGLTGKSITRVPSFLYVLPDKDKVFLEETCLISEVQVPFDELKRRLYKRLQRMNISVAQENIIEEEASWIPLGGSLPVIPQPVLGFGAAAGLVHPASGYSIVNSLSRAEEIADAIEEGLSEKESQRSTMAWTRLWNSENRRKMAFYQFGAGLIAKMPLATLKEFMRAFYALPGPIWKGFLSHRLSSPSLIPLALLMFATGNNDLRGALVGELASPAGIKLFQDATAPVAKQAEEEADTNTDRQTTATTAKESFRRGQISDGNIPSGFRLDASKN
mmetsp:Transcript_18453/g.33059  ORF Transcript_18453/g.33059 Transcript_18453/m.33059 type:complete len:845 (+) Transcript_18453:1089-3623(+)